MGTGWGRRSRRERGGGCNERTELAPGNCHPLVHSHGREAELSPSFCLDWVSGGSGSMKRAHPDYSSSDSELDEPIEVEKESADENG